MKIRTAILLLCVICLAACKKILDEKSSIKLALPDNVPAIQAMLDNDNTMNLQYAATGEASADNYYITDASWSALSSLAQRNMYTWGNDITLTEFPNHWSRLYDVANIANIALESLDKMQPAVNEQAARNNVKGSALYFRALAFFNAVTLWAKAYDSNSAATDPGIPLRLHSDYTTITTRASVQQSYNRIIADCNEAAALLPLYPQHVMRPSAPAAWGLLAKTWLLMQQYDSSLLYAQKCLAVNAALLDYNTLSATATNPVPRFNTEVIMHTTMNTATILSTSNARVDSALYLSYAANDLRRSVFFKSNGNGSYAFKGSYNQSSTLFNGIATDELYLVKAECQARTNRTSDAMTTLNQLLIRRWKTGTFIPYTAATAQAALNIILTERRKELLFRDARWADLKRLNKEPALQQTIYRRLNGQLLQLSPNDNRYALPIPQSVIDISGIGQNPR